METFSALLAICAATNTWSSNEYLKDVRKHGIIIDQDHGMYLSLAAPGLKHYFLPAPPWISSSEPLFFSSYKKKVLGYLLNKHTFL